MKKLLLFLLLAPMLSFSQKIISDRKEIKELKNEVEHYTKVIIESTGFRLNVLVSIDTGGIWHFFNETDQEEYKFNTDTQLFNFMYKNGWVLKEEITQSGNLKSYLFEKQSR